MADHSELAGGHPDMDYSEHDATYHLFLKLMRNVAIVVVVILIFLAYMWG